MILRRSQAGGRGAVRELVERLLFERNEWAGIVDQFLL
jgi:3-deoxy-D-manno-octulosonate 8-phosphate phosphatase KdsC-like HAD superfamily phosphatase